jgi:ubiquinone/menaquinone biosynthesis C-methylase UbiE
MQRVIAPGLRYSQEVYEDALDDLVFSTTRWLDVGCGHHILPEWRTSAEDRLVSRAALVVGIDPDADAVAKHRSIRMIHIGSADNLPFSESSFDLVTANMVVEHMTDPVKNFNEIRRVLSPGGKFLFHTPNLKGYVTAFARSLPSFVKPPLARVLDGRVEADVYPAHYRCNTEETIRSVAALAGFEVMAVRHVSSAAVFARALPVAIIELLWIRATMSERRAMLRTNIISVLQRKE